MNHTTQKNSGSVVKTKNEARICWGQGGCKPVARARPLQPLALRIPGVSHGTRLAHVMGIGNQQATNRQYNIIYLHIEYNKQCIHAYNTKSYNILVSGPLAAKVPGSGIFSCVTVNLLTDMIEFRLKYVLQMKDMYTYI